MQADFIYSLNERTPAQGTVNALRYCAGYTGYQKMGE